MEENCNSYIFFFLIIYFFVCQPPKIRSFINNVTCVPLENIEEPLKGFVWEFDKVPLKLNHHFALIIPDRVIYMSFFYMQGDFHHWVDLFNHFDSFFEKHIKSRKDLQVEDNFLGSDPPFPREAVLQILRVIRIILENCTNKHFYSSYEVCFYCSSIFPYSHPLVLIGH